MGVLCFIYMILALRTNIVFVLIFFFLVPAFSCLAAAYWHLALGTPESLHKASKLQIAGGAFSFVVSMLGWWIFSAIMLAALDFPFQLPGNPPSHRVTSLTADTTTP
jgi:succinate-acetate transporter protein